MRKYGYCDYAGNYFQTLKKLAGTYDAHLDSDCPTPRQVGLVMEATMRLPYMQCSRLKSNPVTIHLTSQDLDSESRKAFNKCGRRELLERWPLSIDARCLTENDLETTGSFSASFYHRIGENREMTFDLDASSRIVSIMLFSYPSKSFILDQFL